MLTGVELERFTQPMRFESVATRGVGVLLGLEMLSACVEYARVPDGYWKEKGKEFVTIIIKTAPEKAAEVAASYVKNPSGQWMRNE